MPTPIASPIPNPITDTDFVAVRSYLAENVDSILEALTALKNSQKQSAGGDDLFGDDTTSTSVPVSWHPIRTPHSPLEVLIEEKNSLGLYVSGNPLLAYQKLLRFARDLTDHDDLHLILIDKTKKIFTRQNMMMLALQLSVPEEGVNYEGIIFPKYAPFLSSKIVDKEIFWVKGRVIDRSKKKTEAPQNDGETKEFEELPKIAIEDIVPVSQNPATMFEADEIKIPVNRQKQLTAVPWSTFAIHPEQFDSYLTNGSLPSGTTTNEVVEIKVPNTVSPELLAQIKSLVKKAEVPGLQKIALWIQTKDEYKRVKGDMWGDVHSIRTLLN